MQVPQLCTFDSCRTFSSRNINLEFALCHVLSAAPFYGVCRSYVISMGELPRAVWGNNLVSECYHGPWHR